MSIPKDIMTLIIRITFLIGAFISLYFSQSDSLPLSWAIFLCFVTAVCIVGVFTWEDRHD